MIGPPFRGLGEEPFFIFLKQAGRFFQVPFMVDTGGFFKTGDSVLVHFFVSDQKR